MVGIDNIVWSSELKLYYDDIDLIFKCIFSISFLFRWGISNFVFSPCFFVGCQDLNSIVTHITKCMRKHLNFVRLTFPFTVRDLAPSKELYLRAWHGHTLKRYSWELFQLRPRRHFNIPPLLSCNQAWCQGTSAKVPCVCTRTFILGSEGWGTWLPSKWILVKGLSLLSFTGQRKPCTFELGTV